MPQQLRDFYVYCRSRIDFSTRPDYAYLKGLLWEAIFQDQFWSIKDTQLKRQESMEEESEDLLLEQILEDNMALIR